MEIIEDDEGNVILDKNSEQERKTPNSRVELLYTYMVLGTSCTIQHLNQRCRRQSRILFLSPGGLNAQDGKVVTWCNLKNYTELYELRSF